MRDYFQAFTFSFLRARGLYATPGHIATVNAIAATINASAATAGTTWRRTPGSSATLTVEPVAATVTACA